MHIRTFLKPLSFIPALLLMYMIFTFSSQEGAVSSDVSLRVSRKIVSVADQALDKNLEQWQIEQYAQQINGITRKAAHMTEYFALAIAVAFPLYVYGLHGILLMLVAGIFCVAFACTDEYHQSFVAGRSPAVRDVLIDSFGVFWGIILVRIIGWTGRKTIFRPIRKNRPNQKSYPTPNDPAVYGYSGNRPVTPGYAYTRYPQQPVPPAYPSGAEAPRPQAFGYDRSVPPRQAMDDLPDETFPMPTRHRP